MNMKWIRVTEGAAGRAACAPELLAQGSAARPLTAGRFRRFL